MRSTPLCRTQRFSVGDQPVRDYSSLEGSGTVEAQVEGNRHLMTGKLTVAEPLQPLALGLKLTPRTRALSVLGQFNHAPFCVA